MLKSSLHASRLDPLLVQLHEEASTDHALLPKTRFLMLQSKAMKTTTKIMLVP